MPAEFVLATRSPDKASEILDIIGAASHIALVTLAQLQIEPAAAEDDVEDFPTFIENALAKARYFARLTGRATLADDSGLMVAALAGAPGVRTKRFAADHRIHTGDTDAANNALLLQKLANVADEKRTAHYVCAAALVRPDGVAISTIGTCSGRIARAPAGSGGFGYDPLFFLPDLDVTFAQLSRAQKHRYSHRARAFRTLAPHLR